ncbi:MAG: glycosyltransferase family 2 protein [Candidatus Hydrogenedentota bacterium]
MTSGNMITVVVCTYTRANYLRRALESLVRQETPDFTYEVVVVDDESTDDTPAVVAEADAHAPIPVRYVLQPGREGLAHVRNRGVAEMQGDWLAFFDDDQLAEPGWLRQLLQVARDHDARLVGGPRRLHLPEETMAQLGPVSRSLLGENLYTGPPTVLNGKELPTTGNLLIGREVIDNVGAFDPKFSGNEDTEFLQRARAAGYAIWTAPEAMCAHLIPQYRTETAYFRWTSLRWGYGFAGIDWKNHGTMKMLAYAAARLAQAAIITVPRWIAARLQGGAAEALDRKLLLWRAQGYARTAFWLAAPRLFPQRRFINLMDFGKERELFPTQEPAL